MLRMYRFQICRLDKSGSEYTKTGKLLCTRIRTFGFHKIRGISGRAKVLLNSKGKIQPRTGHEGPGMKYMYSCTLSLTSTLDQGGCSTPRPGRFTPWERSGTHCIGGAWVGPRAGLNRCEKSHSHRDSISGPSGP